MIAIRVVRAAVAYFAIVMGAGFVLGLIRVPFVAPRIGDRWAELAEMPIMGLVIYGAAGYIVRRFPVLDAPGRALTTGSIAFVLAIVTELGLVAALQDRTVADYVAGRDRISGPVYLAMLVAFALMPMWRRRRSLR